MKQFILLMAVACPCLSGLCAQILHVSSGATGNGQSWESPLGSLQAALRLAGPGDQVWVAQGTYFPVDCENCTPQQRSVTFHVPNGVQVYGGFAGHEISPDQRNWRKHATQLSGHIGRAGYHDNSQTIVFFENAPAKTLLDGFFIIGGNADSEGSPGNPLRSGAGVFNRCTKTGGTSQPTVRNCVFMENLAWEGGAIYNQSQAGQAGAIVQGCSFVKNEASLAGGAIFHDAPSGQVDDCRFVGNVAGFGGAYFCAKAKEEASVFRQCHFIQNQSKAGGACFVLTGDEAYVAGMFSYCIFRKNEARIGGDVFFQKGDQLPDQLLQMVREATLGEW